MTTTITTTTGAAVEGVRIADMPDLGAFTSDSSIVGEHAGSGRFSAISLSGYFLPLSGGNVTGQTTITLNTSGAPPAANALTVTQNASGVAQTSQYSALTAVANRTNATVATTPANRHNCPVLANLAAAIKYIPPGGLAAGYQLPEQWAYISQNYDCSNQPSSIGGATINEYDTAANGADDVGPRAGAVYVFSKIWPIGGPPGPINPAYGPPPSVGGLPAEFGAAIALTTDTDVVIKRGIVTAIAYSSAAVDTRLAKTLVGTIQTTVAAGGTSLHVNNVVAYLSWGPNGSPVSSGNPMPVAIGANTYSVIGAAFDAPTGGTTTTNMGVLTLSSGIVGTDGTAGNSVVSSARTVWLADGQQVALSSSGAVYMSGAGGGSGGQLTIHAPDYVEIKGGSFLVDGSINAGNTISAAGSVVLGSPNFATSAVAYFHPSGNTGADATIQAFAGTGANDGSLSVTAGSIVLNVQGKITFGTLPPNAPDDASAASAGVPPKGVYRNGSVLMVRVA
jgi:hypothetical protein